MTIDRSSPVLLDTKGHPLFTCCACQTPLSASDLIDLGLRAPDRGETAEEYCDSELLNPAELRHTGCLERAVDDLL